MRSLSAASSVFRFRTRSRYTAWRGVGYDDSGWLSSAAMFYAPTNPFTLPAPKHTLLPLTNSAGEIVLPALVTGNMKKPAFSPDVKAVAELQKQQKNGGSSCCFARPTSPA